MSNRDYPGWKPKHDEFKQHPENDLQADADFTNRPRPTAHSAEELAGGGDPAELLAKNQQSGRQALTYAIGAPLTLMAIAFVLLLISRMVGGPLCDAGQATWICTEFTRIWWPTVTSILAFAGLLLCAFIMVRKLNRHLRWWPWMGAFWLLLPLSMLWMTSVLPIAIIGGDLIF